MWRVSALVLLSVAVAAQEKYPITLTIVSSDSVPYSSTSNAPMDTTCNSDAFGHTDCSTTGGQRTTSNRRIIQSAAATDGNLYILECEMGARARFGIGFAAGTGNSITNGCMIRPGEYKARTDKHGFKMLITDDKGKPKEVTMGILSVQKKELPK